jgi:hypothetical protein
MIKYDVSSGLDIVTLDDGTGLDNLVVSQRGNSFRMLDKDGGLLYSHGEDGSVINIFHFESGQVLGDDLKVVFQW